METRMTERVAKGVALLDSKVSDWRSRIDVRTLDLSDYWDCVVGQVFGSFSEAQRELNINSHTASYEHGFDLVDGNADEDDIDPRDNYNYDDLRDEWLKHLS